MKDIAKEVLCISSLLKSSVRFQDRERNAFSQLRQSRDELLVLLRAIARESNAKYKPIMVHLSSAIEALDSQVIPHLRESLTIFSGTEPDNRHFEETAIRMSRPPDY